ncbi:MAG: prephenate dehydrogenase [Candidatus Limnocylindria bacterium]
MKIGVAGLGLIGGSLALALRDRHEVTGYDTDERARAAAKADGIRIAASLEELVPADAVLVATPISRIVPTLEGLVGRSDGAVLVDTGSLKRVVADYATRAPVNARIVGGHPMAGTTSAGFSAADPDIFRGRAFLLVPTARSDDGAMAVAGAIVRDVGATVTVCSADVHDRAMARLVAGPLATSAALAVVGAQADPLLSAAGPGFRDSTRLADTPADLAIELLFGNAADAAGAIGSIIEALTQLRQSLERGDREYVRSFLAAARSVRSELAR